MDWPRYCCAILETDRGAMLFQQRSASARQAAGMLTCFGGGRHPGEEPEAALRRELREELGWEPRRLEFRVALWVANEPVAWFYAAELDVSLESLRPAPGHVPELVTPDEFDRAPISPWHRAVIEAHRAGRDRVDLPA